MSGKGSVAHLPSGEPQDNTAKDEHETIWGALDVKRVSEPPVTSTLCVHGAFLFLSRLYQLHDDRQAQHHLTRQDSELWVGLQLRRAEKPEPACPPCDPPSPVSREK